MESRLFCEESRVFPCVEGKGGGEFYTPSSIVKTLVEMIEP